ncbi:MULTISPECIES: class F sortase [Rhodococcus]|uniref:class F sortase n=1 Tax=Rhodococcus TaxID=1827 RepID=UPI001E453096|nr:MULTISPECIES: class F sortase [Rhodococcus]MCJ0950178.1 class F sortase [Rhodococcus sp. ARC_M8]UKO84008.1 class F sortase [Rhodococcus erythropolis]ULD41103.1 class F sortase [Rhodococcus qingshengii]
MTAAPGSTASRTWAAAVVATMLLIGGCSDDGDSPTRVLATGQQDLPPAVRAAVDGPDVPTTLRTGNSTADILPIKTTTDGSLIPPEDVSEIGWWADSAFPGSGAGTVVITGHVNDIYQGDGFGKKFSTLEIGSVVTVAGAGGQTWNYRIDAVDHYGKDGELPVERLNSLDGPETLALITCGGEFVGPPFGYEDNDVAWGTPVPA